MTSAMVLYDQQMNMIFLAKAIKYNYMHKAHSIIRGGLYYIYCIKGKSRTNLPLFYFVTNKRPALRQVFYSPILFTLSQSNLEYSLVKN